MKLIVCGGRDYQDRERVFGVLDWIHSHFRVDTVLSGGAPGADKIGEDWAIVRGIEIRIFGADWDTHGKAAGPIRNAAMAKAADACVAFPGGRGTADMVRRAKSRRLKLWEHQPGVGIVGPGIAPIEPAEATA